MTNEDCAFDAFCHSVPPQLGNPVIKSLDSTNLQWVAELLRAYNKGTLLFAGFQMAFLFSTKMHLLHGALYGGQIISSGPFWLFALQSYLREFSATDWMKVE